MKCAASVFLVLALVGVASAAVIGQKADHAASTSSPVERVVNLLKDMKDRLETDDKVEQKIYDKYACWCETTTKRKAEAITEAMLQLRTLGHNILSLKGKIATSAVEVNQLDADMKSSQKAQDEATSMREKENSAFMKESEETKEALAALEKAVSVLVAGSKPGALIQEQSTTEAMGAVKHLVEAMPASKPLKFGQLALLNEFLSAGTGAKYTPQSATVQGMLKDMYETFANDLQSATQGEATSNANFENLIAVKVEEFKANEKSKKEKEEEKAAAEAQLADAQQMYDDTGAQKQADIDFFDETKAACQSKHEQWSTRSLLRDEEVSGIDKALEILTSDDARALFASSIKPGKEVGAQDKYDTGRDITSLLQVGSDAAPAEQAYAALKSKATATHSLRLGMLAVQVREATAGHFDEVIGSIDKMIQVLRDENSADIAKRDQCKEEYHKIESTSKDLAWNIEKNEAKIDRLAKLIDQLSEEKEQTIQELADIRGHMSALTGERQAENSAFKNSKKDDQESIDLLMDARTALSSYYKDNKIDMGPIQGSVKGASLVQQEPEFDVSADQAPGADFSDKGKRKGESKDIVSLMTMIVEDLNDEIKNDMKAEEKAQLDYENQMKAAKRLEKELIEKKDSLEGSIAKRGKDKGAEIADKTANEKDLQDEADYKKRITPDCDFILGAFAKRSASRTAEMEGLQGAKSTLAGAKLPAAAAGGGAALLERRGKPFDDKALRRVRFMGLDK